MRLVAVQGIKWSSENKEIPPFLGVFLLWRHQRGALHVVVILWLDRQDSNLRMTGPKPVALPLGDGPILYIVA